MRSTSVYLLLLLASLAAAMVPVVFPSLDIAVSAYFFQPNPPIKPSEWTWVQLVNEHTPTIFRVLAILCIPAWVGVSLVPKFRRWALPIAFIGLSVALGPGLLTKELKENVLRSRPFYVKEFGGDRQFTPALVVTHQCDDNCSFTSGHAACGFVFATLMLLDRRRRWWWVAAGLVGGALVSFARVSVGAHWLSDVLWALPVTLVGGWIVWLFLSLIYRQQMKTLNS